MSDTTIDDIFDAFNNNEWLDMHTMTDIEPDVWLECMHLTDKAKSALYDLILKDVIGEDEQPIDLKMTDKNTAIFINNKIAFCNGLRAEQRNKLKGLFE